MLSTRYLNDLQKSEHVGGEGRSVRLGEDVFHLAVGADDVRDALRVSALRGVRRAVLHAHGARRIRQERIGEVEFFGEVLVLLNGIEADAQDDRVLRGKITGSIPEPAALQGSTRGVGLRVEPEDDVLAAQIAELHRLALMRSEGEIRRRVADVQHGHGPPRIRWSGS